MVNRGFFPTREKAKRAILAGYVKVYRRSGKEKFIPIENCKPGDDVKVDDVIEITQVEKYVSRGGYKLEHAIHYFNIDVRGKIALDVGASTGGFTDCLLQHGAAIVYAIDVGKGQLAWKIRNDPRVVVMEGINARYLNRSHFPSGFTGADLATIDCSFISLKLIIPPLLDLLNRRAKIVALIKPQFEAGKEEADKGKGIIEDPMVHKRVLEDFEVFIKNYPNLNCVGIVESPIKGQSGNIEFLAYVEKTS